MNIKNATDEQLQHICRYDHAVPKIFLDPIVNESLERGLYDPIIEHIIKHTFFELKKFLYATCMSKEEIMQIARLSIFESLSTYKFNQGAAFNTFAFRNAKTCLMKLLERYNSQKREVYKYSTSLDKQIGDVRVGEHYYLIDRYKDTEKQALLNIAWEQALSMVNEREKRIINYLMDGYSLKDMTVFFNIKTRAGLHRSLHQAFKKINPDSPKIDLHELGLVYKPKVG